MNRALLLALVVCVGCASKPATENGKPKLMYAWTLPGDSVVRTCIPGEQFVDSKGQIYVCGQWPPYEKP